LFLQQQQQQQQQHQSSTKHLSPQLWMLIILAFCNATEIAIDIFWVAQRASASVRWIFFGHLQPSGISYFEYVYLSHHSLFIIIVSSPDNPDMRE
jgi:hypothetical protein